MEHNEKNICRTSISAKEQMNKQIAEFVIFILFQYFMSGFFKVF